MHSEQKNENDQSGGRNEEVHAPPFLLNIGTAMMEAFRYMRPTHFIEYGIILFFILCAIEGRIGFPIVWIVASTLFYPIAIYAVRLLPFYARLFTKETFGQSLVHIVKRGFYWKFQAPDAYEARDFEARSQTGEIHEGTIYREHRKGSRYIAERNFAILLMVSMFRELFLRTFIELFIFFFSPLIAVVTLPKMKKEGNLEGMRRTI